MVVNELCLIGELQRTLLIKHYYRTANINVQKTAYTLTNRNIQGLTHRKQKNKPQKGGIIQASAVINMCINCCFCTFIRNNGSFIIRQCVSFCHVQTV